MSVLDHLDGVRLVAFKHKDETPGKAREEWRNKCNFVRMKLNYGAGGPVRALEMNVTFAPPCATLNHFTRILRHTTITTFSATERQKYPASFPALTSGLLFSDELRDRHPEFLNERNQSIEFWISSAQNGRTLGKLGYSTRNAELADVVKVLVSENEMETLLMLARHPQIPLGTLKNLSWGHHFGFSRISESALHVYAEIDLWAAMGLLEGGEYLELESYRRMLWNSTYSGDYPRHAVPHQAY
ncbi:hypothetical protein DXG01_009379 [Tephrocybe rancida]|nr:hypothetical protein DXG01_009379 [Tephrocybe rancida]